MSIIVAKKQITFYKKIMRISFIYQDHPIHFEYDQKEKKWNYISSGERIALIDEVLKKNPLSKELLIKELDFLGARHIHFIDDVEGKKLDEALQAKNFQGFALFLDHGLVLLQKSYQEGKFQFSLETLSTLVYAKILQTLKVDKKTRLCSLFPEGYYPALDPNITLEDVINHLSGLYPLEELRDLSHPIFHTYQAPHMLLHLILKRGAVAKPGVHYQPTYSNSILLACVIEKITGESIDAVVKKYLPLLGLTHTRLDNSSFCLESDLSDTKKLLSNLHQLEHKKAKDGEIIAGGLLQNQETLEFSSLHIQLRCEDGKILFLRD